eukprot:5076577-Prymnesium_polylepis.1
MPTTLRAPRPPHAHLQRHHQPAASFRFQPRLKGRIELTNARLDHAARRSRALERRGQPRGLSLARDSKESRGLPRARMGWC